MLGFRGCRLGIIYPEITEMQARAIIEAAANVRKRGIKVEPEVMIPLVGNPKELEHQDKIVRSVAEGVMKREKVKFNYLVVTMIEVPRGAITADEIAKTAEFFSFGTNDLTQTTLGVSRDDATPRGGCGGLAVSPGLALPGAPGAARQSNRAQSSEE